MGKTALIACITLIFVVVSSAIIAPALADTEFVQAVTKPVYVLTLSPASATDEVDMDYELTATLTKDGVAVAGQKVSWSIKGVGSWVGTPDARTDSNGHAYTTITSSKTGTTVVTVSMAEASRACSICGTFNETETVSAKATKVWTARKYHVYALELSPSAASNPVGTYHELTATLTRDGVPFQDQSVSWSKSGVGDWSGTPDATTDGNGQAHATITSDMPGLTTVYISNKASTCTVCGNTDTISAMTIWTISPVSSYILTLSPTSAMNIVGTNHELTATLTCGGVALSYDVFWSISGVGNWVGTPDARTDSSGQAHATITSNQEGTTTVTVSVTVLTYIVCTECGNVHLTVPLHAVATKIWQDPSDDGNPPVIVPGSPTCNDGGTCGHQSMGFSPPLTSETKTDGEMQITVTLNGTSISWTSNYPVCKVIVIGEDNANIYFGDLISPYGDSGLHAPPDNNGNIPTPSSIIFCYDSPDPPVPEASTIILLSLGLLAIAALGGFAWYGMRRRKVVA